MQIRPIIKSFYSADEVQTLANNILRESGSLTPPNDIITALTKSLQTSFDELQSARGYSKVNTQTQLVAAADEIRDLKFRAFYTYVEAWSLRQGNEHQSAAQKVLVRLGKIDRLLPYMGYSSESAELQLLFNEMTQVTKELKTIGADTWLEELKTAETTFLDSQKSKLDEEVQKKSLVRANEAKEKTLVQMIALVQTLNGLEIADMAGIAELNKQIDQVIAEIEIPARARQSRKTVETSTEGRL